MKKHSIQWWALVFVHNWVVHPLLPLGDVLEAVAGKNVVSEVIYWTHDNSAPYGAG